jgi:hypothetical protein
LIVAFVVGACTTETNERLTNPGLADTDALIDASDPSTDTSVEDVAPDQHDAASPDEDAATDEDVATDDDVASDEDTSTDINSVELAWFSDWRTATGTSQNALYDGSKWSGQLCMHDVAAIVAADGLDFPTTNVFRSDYVGLGNCLMIQARDRWLAPQVGEYLFVRLYYRNAMPDGAVVGNPHPIHIGTGTNGQAYTVVMNFTGPNNGVSRMRVNLPGAQQWPDAFWSYPFNTHETYRIEFRLHRVTQTTARLDLRVYDSANNLVGDNDDFHNGETGANSRTLTESDPTLTVDDHSFTLLELGNNDPAGADDGDDWFVYWGAAAVVVSDDAAAWPGPYPAGAERF